MLETKVTNAKVFIRIFPMAKTCWKYVKVLNDRKHIYVRRLQDFGKGYEGKEPLYWKFNTDGIFYNCLQQEIFDKVVSNDIIEDLFEGHNLVLFVYGPTGTGKTLTASGLLNVYEDRGIAPRFIETLFQTAKSLEDKYRCAFKMSYVETSKMFLVDLFDDNRTMLTMNDIKSVKTVSLQSKDEALKLLFEAEGRREFVKDSTYDAHAKNGVLSFYVHTKSLKSSDSKVTVTQIHIVDMSGVDSVGNIECDFKHFSDIGSSNLAKSQLEQFLMVLIENIPEKVFVKHRLNILVHYLKDVLKSSSYLRFVGHVRIRKQNLMLTLSMLRFAQIVRNLKCTLGPSNKIMANDIDYKMLQHAVLKLEQQQHLNNIFNKDYSPELTTDKMECIKSLVQEYLHNNLNEMELFHVSDVNTIIKVVKEMYNNLETKKVQDIKNVDKSIDEIAKSANLDNENSKQTKKTIVKKRNSNSDTSLGNRKSTGSKSSLVKSNRRSSSSKNVSTLSKKPSIITEEAESVSTVIETMPEYDEAYNAFMEAPNYQYKYYNNLLIESELELNNLHQDYLEEVKKLRSLEDVYTKYTEHYMILQMQNELVLSSQHNIQVDLIKVESDLVFQKEAVLTKQSAVKLQLQYYHNMKKELEAEFDRFCTDKYKTILPSLDESENMYKETLQSVLTFNETEVKLEMDNVLLTSYKILQKNLRKQIDASKLKKDTNKPPCK